MMAARTLGGLASPTVGTQPLPWARTRFQIRTLPALEGLSDLTDRVGLDGAPGY